jgi:hypothetical protein
MAMPDDAGCTWVYYRVFLKNPADPAGFRAILAEVIAPIGERFAGQIEHFHFSFHTGPYHAYPEGIVERLEDVKDDEPVALLRLMFLVRDEAEAAVRINLLHLLEGRAEVRGCEKPMPPYRIGAGLADKFGYTRLPDILRLLDAASRLAVSFSGPEAVAEGPSALLDLVSNILHSSDPAAPMHR